MNRWSYRVCALLLLACPTVLLAQHRGTHGAGAAGAPAGPPASDDMKDFSRAVALQATPEQANVYQQLTASLASAKKGVLEFQHPTATPPTSDISRAKALSDAADETFTDGERFLSSFSDAQKSGLKELAKKFRKANSEIAKENKALTGNLTHASTAVERLDKALHDLEDNQTAIGKEMGVPAVDSH